MNENILLYFSEEEFALMMELAGGKEYSLFLTEPKLDERSLSAALVRLYRRGLLLRAGDSFILSESGAFFRELRNAARIVLFRAEYPEQKTVLFYASDQSCWAAELQNGSRDERYRIRTMSVNEIRSWLLDMRILPMPQLEEADTAEIRAILRGELERIPDISADVTICIQDHDCGAWQRYELYSEPEDLLVCERADGKRDVRLYTREAFRDMLQQCFGGNI